MSEVKKTVKKEVKSDPGLDGKICAIGRILDKVVRYLETIHGADINGDGKVGGAKICLLIGTFIVAAATMCFAIDNAWMLLDDDNYWTTTGNIVASGTISGTSSTSGTGTISTVTAADTDYGNTRKTVLTLADVPLLISTDENDTNAWGSVKIYDFPEGRILVHGVTVDGVLLTLDTDTIPSASGGDFAFGTVEASSNVLTSTMVDLCPSTSVDTLTNTVNSALSASAQFDGTTTAKDMYFNMAIDHDDSTFTNNPCTNSVSAVVTVTWSNLGDY